MWFSLFCLSVNVLFYIASDCLEYVVCELHCPLNQCEEQWIYTVGSKKSETIERPAFKLIFKYKHKEHNWTDQMIISVVIMVII